MSIDWEERHRVNNEHADKPLPGDYWEEMFSGQYMVCAVTADIVAYCKDKVQVDPDHWSFDLTKITVCTRAEFSALVHYNTTGTLRNKTWCDVHPRRLLEDVHESMPAVKAAVEAYRKIVKPTWTERLVKRVRAALKARLLAWAEAL